MTFADIENIRGEVLSATQVGAYLHTNPQAIREQARECPEMLGFPVIVVGTRVIIPKAGFLAYISGKEVR